jgi:peptide-methionine (R)-S-oxide reductase
VKVLLLITLAIFGSTMDVSEKTTHSEQEWLQILGTERYTVMRRKGTERAFIGEYTYKEGPATYHCAACDLALFNGLDQYDARSGYPSFTQAISSEKVYFEEDRTLSFKRYEILCRGCDSHLGHIFNDGPLPKKLRYCINSISLKRIGK